MSNKNIILKAEKKLILPSDVYPGNPVNIPMGKALQMGLMTPARRVKGRKIPAAPAGMGVFAKFAIQVLDKAGKPVLFRNPLTGKMVRKMERPVHSFTRQFGFWIRGMFQNDLATLNINETLTDDTGATFLARVKSSALTGNIALLTGLAKIKFGNSNAALSNAQINLQGTLLGPTTEAAVTVALVVEDSVNTIFTVTGQITNGTGGPFSVEEMGLFPELNDSTAGANRTTMMLRDLTGTVAVANGQTIIGQYTFTIAV